MEIINLNLEDHIENNYETGIALGNFDGIHIAHKKLIEEMVIDAKKNNLKPGVLLFNNHSKAMVEGKSPSILTSQEQKLQILGTLGIEIIYMIDFDKKFMELSPEEFVCEILIKKLNAKRVCIGFDYKFGFKASGDSKTLNILGNKYGIGVKVIDPIFKDNIISSTRIRNLLLEGEIELANSILGRQYSIIGKVVDGSKRGNKLGFPTANIELNDDYIVPKKGVYETVIILEGKSYLGATSIGINPTFKNDVFKIENHIINFNKSIYGKNLEVRFVRYMRDEVKFDNIEQLKEQIQKDKLEIESKY